MSISVVYGGNDHRLAGEVIAEITMKDRSPETGELEGTESVHYHPDMTEEEKEHIRISHPFIRNYPEI